jgi:hypothetical protein
MSGASPFGQANYNTTGQVRVRIIKSGTIFQIFTTGIMGLYSGAIQPGQPNPYTLLFQFDLTDINTWTGAPSYAVGDELLKFTGPSRIGYLSSSQPLTQFYDIFLDSFQQPLNSLFSDTTSGVVLGNVYTFEEVSGCWEYSGLTSNYPQPLTTLTVESEFEDCSVCNEEPNQSCNCYQIATNKSLTISYIDCSGNTQTKLLSTSVEGFALICAIQTPTVVSDGNSPYIIELFDNCINGFCARRPNCSCYSITNNSSTYTLTYWYYDCNYEYQTGDVGPNRTSEFFCSIMVPFIINPVGFTINSFGNCSDNECSGSIECNILDLLLLRPNDIDTSSILTWDATYSGPNAGLLYMDVFASWFCTGGTPLNCTRTVYFNGGGTITSILEPSCPWSTGDDVMEITGNSSSGTILFGRAPNGTPCSLTDVDYMLITLYYECPDGSVFSTTTYYGLPNNSF